MDGPWLKSQSPLGGGYHPLGQRTITLPAPEPIVGLGDEIGWWSASLDSDDGQATDLTGNGLTGTLNGATVVADTDAGGTKAWDFGGGSDNFHINFGNTFDTGDSDDLACSLWARVRSYSNLTSGFVSQDSGSPYPFTVHVTNAGAAQFKTDNNGVGGGTVFVGNTDWVHVYSDNSTANQKRIFVNGILINSEPKGTVSPSEFDLIFGYDIALATGRFLDGRMDDVRFYSRPLTQDEITHLATSRGILGAPS